MSEGLPSVGGRKRIEITEDSLDAPIATTAPSLPSPVPPAPSSPPLPAATLPKFSPAPLAPRRASFCRACGAAIDDRAAMCPHCGVAVAQSPAALSTHQAVALTMNQKSPGTAAVLSLLFTGAGQVYCGRAARGVAFFGAAFLSALLILVVIGLILLPIVWVWAAIDAHSLAQRQNQALLASVAG
ncbi:MAG TPA: zinc ribbon domain-containing protein [Solirubrobacteraceae bacterium]|jgi:TM2 domain-containing membrane protein YozV